MSLAAACSAALIIAFNLTHASGLSPPINVKIQDHVVHRITPRLFGQFMERPSWGGEIGSEAALIPGTNELRPAVKELIQKMRIPILRFPGATDVDYINWQDMVDNVPGRPGGRPITLGHRGDAVTNNFGYDEFLSLCEEIKATPLLVINFRDGLLAEDGPDRAARHAAKLLAYCNAEIGADLPAELSVWPRLRAENVHAAPFAVKYFQIGNETWNGWWSHPASGRPANSIYRTQAFDALFAKGAGAAGMLHAIMRRGDVIEIAAQSMLVGDKWDIHAIYADRNALIPPYILPTGQVTMLYSRFHGHDLLGVEVGNMAYYEQPYRMGSIVPATRVAYLDILATRDANTLYLHAINRHFNQALSVQFDISDLHKQPAAYGTIHILEGRLANEPAADDSHTPGWIRDTTFRIAGKIFQVHLPARSVTVAEVQLH